MRASSNFTVTSIIIVHVGIFWIFARLTTAGRVTRVQFHQSITALAGVVALVAGFIVTSSAQPAAAFSGSDFNAGNIISDANFFNGNAMSAHDVQAFLNARVPTCTINNGQLSHAAGAPVYRSDGTIYSYIASACLKNYVQTTPTMPAQTNANGAQICSAYTGQANESAASIIARVGQACNISQKVLLVLLDKEQSLVSDSWPNLRQYDEATGFECYDNGQPCIGGNAGFFKQVWSAARQFQRYGTGSFTWYPVGKVSNILYQANMPSCGTKPVLIQNRATAALYYYTPYTPNAAALNNLFGTGDACSAYGNRNFWRIYFSWFGSPSGNSVPTGWLDGVTSQDSKISIKGWAFDTDSPDPIKIHVYVDSIAQAHTADSYRPDVGNAFNVSANRGFDIDLHAGPGAHRVCIYAINDGAGGNVLLGCREVTTIPSGVEPAIGWWEPEVIEGKELRLRGWAVDFDSVGPVSVQVQVDGGLSTSIANTSRADIASVYPGFGKEHGFDFTRVLAAGSHRVCLSLLNGQDPPTALGCRNVSIAATSTQTPIGFLDSISVIGDQITARGWALDKDTSESISVHMYVGGTGQAFSAMLPRSDVGIAFPGYGDSHGFQSTMRGSPGANLVCIYAINDGSGANVLLGCRNVTIRDEGKAPFGWLDSVEVVGDAITAKGWAVDPDTTNPISVHMYVDGHGVSYTANSLRKDVGLALPGFGDNHGFDLTETVAQGKHNVCLYAINNGAGGHAALGCKTVYVGDASRAPTGWIDEISVSGNQITVRGWALDLDTPAAIQVHIYLDATGASFLADKDRPDVGFAFPTVGSMHGFNASVSSSPGAHRVCVYAINNGAGGNVLLGCKSLIVG